jgi:hypothetical protein
MTGKYPFFFERQNKTMQNYVKNSTFNHGKIIVKLEFKDIPLTTDSFPNIQSVLNTYLPSIFQNECYNPQNLSFFEESKRTEIGHLFEHVLLEYMCLIKIPYVKEVTFSGRTYWNPQNLNGCFRVEVKCNIHDWPIFNIALKKAIKLMDKIFLTSNQFPEKGQFGKQTTPA